MAKRKIVRMARQNADIKKEMAELTSLGLDFFGDLTKFKLWLDTPSFALGNMKPMELLKDSYGKELIITELVRINHGILV